MRRPFVVASAVLLVAALLAPASVAAAGKPGYPDRITWSGRAWQVKTSRSAVGPGPCRYSAAPENVSVDGAGNLRLRIANQGGTWTCAEIIGTETFGYGTYRFELASPVHDLDPNVVLGLFTWSDKAAYAHREIDIEIARWGSATDPTNAQYVVQPHTKAGHLVRFSQPADPTSTHAFTWRSGSVAFSGTAPSGTIHAWTYTGSDVPKPGGENVRLNLWLFGGSPPTNGQPVEVVVRSFTFTP